MPNKYRVIWICDNTEFAMDFMDADNVAIEQIPERFKTQTGRGHVRIIRVEKLGEKL
jgi:hypothetical protein